MKTFRKDQQQFSASYSNDEGPEPRSHRGGQGFDPSIAHHPGSHSLPRSEAINLAQVLAAERPCWWLPPSVGRNLGDHLFLALAACVGAGIRRLTAVRVRGVWGLVR
jgi:hypothetical protein